MTLHPAVRRGLWVVAWLMLCGVGLGGCASLRDVRTEVATFGEWPAGRQAGPYAFERLPSQDSEPARQAELEAAAQPALAATGFSLAASPEQAAYTVQLGVQVQVDRRVRPDPFFQPYAAAPVLVPSRKKGEPPRWVYPAHSVYGGGWGLGGMGFAMSAEPPWVQMQVSVLVRDARSKQMLYESRASADRMGAADPALWAPLFRAALQGFPQATGSRRTVTVSLDGAEADGPEPAAPAALPESQR